MSLFYVMEKFCDFSTLRPHNNLDLRSYENFCPCLFNSSSKAPGKE